MRMECLALELRAFKVLARLQRKEKPFLMIKFCPSSRVFCDTGP